jgi:hypothetical protein
VCRHGIDRGRGKNNGRMRLGEGEESGERAVFKGEISQPAPRILFKPEFTRGPFQNCG